MSISRKAMTATAVGLSLTNLVRAVRRARYPLQGKVVFITGGSRGLGLELARQFARGESKLVLVARDAAELARAKADLAPTGAEVLTVAADLEDPQAAKQAALSGLARFGHVDVLVNCAGQIGVGPVETMHFNDFDRAMRANFFAAANCVEALLPSMQRREQGRIVNIASVGGLVGVPHLSPYVASKFALTGYSLTLRAELAKDGIKVVTVCPGLMRTGSPRKATFKGDAAREYAWFKLSDSLPFLSMNAETAARRIVVATQAGDARLILTIQAKVAALLEALAPDLATALAGVANRFLPQSRRDAAAVAGETLPDRVPGALTVLGDRAARRNNEGAPDLPATPAT